MYQTGRTYIYELDGFAHKMPKVFVLFTISGMALMGVPGLCGFVSKWNLVKAAVASRTPLAYVGVAALLISALLTAIYMLSISVRAFFPGKQFDYGTIRGVKDPNWMMILPLTVFAVAMFCFGLHPAPLLELFRQVVSVF